MSFMDTKRALICSNYMPQADLDSFTRRLLHFVEFLHEAGWSITCVAKNPQGVEQYAALLEELGVSVHVGFDEHVERLASENQFDVAILGFWYIAAEVIKTLRQYSPTTRIIVDSGDLHFLRQARRILRESPDELDVLDGKYASETVGELNAYAAADAVFAVSQKEADFVSDFVGDSLRAYVVPDCEELPRSSVPFAKRRGVLFLGNFQHYPNVEAVEFLCREVLTQFDPASLREHPVYIAGNAMTSAVRKCGEGLPFVRMLGWVPSIEPYFERVRVSILPLLHGAGTKRKMIQALAIGTPTVSTSIGAEGFALRDGEEVLIADDPIAFANAIARLLSDEELWERLTRQGYERIIADHGRDTARERLMGALAAVLAKPVRQVAAQSSEVGSSEMSDHEYQQLVRRTRESICKTAPERSTVMVVSRGDDALLNLGKRSAWHFPQGRDGLYAGCYPSNSAEAITQLETLRNKGGDFLVFPKSSLWWLDHYKDFRQHLETRYRVAFQDENSCRIFSLREGPTRSQDASDKPCRRENGSTQHDPVPVMAAATETFDIEAHRPVALDIKRRGTSVDGTSHPLNALVLGIYLADRLNNIEDIVQTLSQTSVCQVTQRWVSLGGEPPKREVADVTACKLTGNKPKFEILNELLAAEDLTQFDYVLLCDDDIVLPHHFADHFLSLQSRLDFALAQPARTSESYIDHPIVEQQRGVVARQTLFVEIGPVVSVHKSAFDLLFPFDLISPMGWGYENVWAHRLTEQALRMGIIDAVPVDHSMRKPVVHYSWVTADEGRTALWEKHTHLALDRCMRVLDVIPIPDPGELLGRQKQSSGEEFPAVDMHERRTASDSKSAISQQKVCS
jgi:glycosyltransferase involved in cell wall biosynthesis